MLFHHLPTPPHKKIPIPHIGEGGGGRGAGNGIFGFIITEKNKTNGLFCKEDGTLLFRYFKFDSLAHSNSDL